MPLKGLNSGVLGLEHGPWLAILGHVRAKSASGGRMQGENAFKLGSILLLIGFAIGAAGVASDAPAVTSLEEQQSSSNAPAEKVVAQDAVSAALTASLGLNNIRDEVNAVEEVNQINTDKFQPFQINN